jgi:hypothetical protein
MTLDKNEAAQALAQIEHSRALSFSLYSYRMGAPYLILFGVMWLVADLLLEFKIGSPDRIWPLTSLAGSLGCAVIAFAQFRRRRRGEATNAWRALFINGLVFAFVAATFVIFAPFTGRLWMGWRLLAVSAVLIGLSLFGFFQIHQHYEAYMAMVGGGCLILGGLWLRKV